MKKYFLLPALLGVLLIVSGLTETGSPASDKGWLISRFDALDLALNNGEGYSRSTNEKGALSWAESYLLESYLDMYDATGDGRYLDKFSVQAERVAKKTDRARGIHDYSGRSRIGWSATIYSTKMERVVHIAHSGMIIYPLVRFASLVKDNPELYRYARQADRYVNLAVEAVAEFKNQWRYDAAAKEGSYWFTGDEPIKVNLAPPMPFNATLALGRVLILLYRITGDLAYRTNARALALRFKRNLVPNGRGGYIWGYRPDMKKYPTVEDLSHGAIDVGFAIEAYKSSLVFSIEDLVKLGRTLVDAKSDGMFSVYVDGKSDGKDRIQYSDASGRWLDLSEYDCAVYAAVDGYLGDRIRASRKEHPQILLGIAKLTKYYDQCRGTGRRSKP